MITSEVRMLYSARCEKCGAVDDVWTHDRAGVGDALHLPDQACACGCADWVRVMSRVMDLSSLWAKQCRGGWDQTPEAQQAISGRSYT